MDNSISYIASIRGKEKACNNGYVYGFDKKSKKDDQLFFYLCERQRYEQCPARIHVKHNTVVKRMHQHNHVPNRPRKKTWRIASEMKVHAATTVEPIMNTIVANRATNIPGPVVIMPDNVNYGTRKKPTKAARVEPISDMNSSTSEVNKVKQNSHFNRRKKVIICSRSENPKMLSNPVMTPFIHEITEFKEENNCELYSGVNNVGNTYSLNSFNGNVQAEKQSVEKDIVETAAVNPMEFKLRQSEFMEAQKQQAEFIEAQKQQAEFMEAQKQQAEFMEAQKQQAEFMEAQKQQAEKLAEERQQRQNENKVYKYMVLNHEKKILETLRTLWKGNQFCDAMLQNECVSIPVHKILLIACCPKILETYDYIMKDTNVQVCFPRKVSADALRAFVDYLYNGSLNLSKSILDSMEYLSGMLGLDDIRQLCNQFRLDLFNDSNNVPDKTIVTVSHSQTTSGLHLSLSNPPATPPPPIIRLSSQTTLPTTSTTNLQMPSSPHYQDNRRVSYTQKSSENRYSILPEQSTDSEVLDSIKLEPEVDLTVDDCTEVKQEITTYQNSEDCQFGSWPQIDSQSDNSLSHRKKNDSTNFDIQTTVDLSVTPLKSFTSHSQKTASHDDPDLQSVITISPSNSPLHSPTSVDSSPDVQTFEVDSETPNLKTHLNPYPVGLVMANTHNLSLPENNRKKRSSFEDFDVDFECKKSKMALQ